MKYFTVFKQRLSRLGRKKPAVSAYARHQVRIHAGPENQSLSRTRDHRLARLKRKLLAARAVPQQAAYTRPAARKPSFRMVLGVLPVSAAVVLFVTLHGAERLYDRLQSLAFFKVTSIEVDGNRMVPREKVAEATGIILHQTSLVGLDTSRIAAQLVGVSWVKRAEVKRNWPSTVEIEVQEDVPVAILSAPESREAPLQYLDRTGTPILPVSAVADMDFPVITGLTGLADAGKKKEALGKILTFLRQVGRNDPHLPAQSISEIHLNPDGEMVVYMVEYPFPIFFGNGNTSRNYSRLVQVLRALYRKPNAKELLSQITYIQMDYLNDKVLVAEGGAGQ